MNLKRKICVFFDYVKYIVLYEGAAFVSLFMKRKPEYKDLWLISERKTDARDNGYHFFKYMCEKHREINCAYVIEKTSPDYEKVASLGRVIEPGSFEHYIAFAASVVKISTHLMGPAPDTYRFSVLDRVFGLVGGKKVLIRHGVSFNTLPGLFYPKARLDLLVCTAKKEYEDIVANYGHKKGVVQRLGLCRYDRLLEPHEVKRQILVMPTWRYYLRTLEKEEFKKTDYYRNFNNLITNERLLKLLDEYDYEINLYLHYELQKYIDLFEQKSDRVHVLKMANSDVQDLLMKSALLITDFSSVYFDFSYMNKPILYWQFDEEMFYKTQYERGYFSCREDGFGPVIDDNDDEKVVDFIESELKDNMQVKPLYKERTDKFFTERTSDHCLKTYEAIKKLLI